MPSSSPNFAIDPTTGRVVRLGRLPATPLLAARAFDGTGDGASLLVLSSRPACPPFLVEPVEEGGVLVAHAREGVTQFESHADVIAELLEAEDAEEILENAGAADGVFHWDMDLDAMVFSRPACELLDLPESGAAGSVGSSELLDFLEPDDQAVLVLAALGAVINRKSLADVRVAVRGGFDSARLRIVLRKAYGGERVLEGVIRRVGR